jgi:hypothetical protein
MSPQESTIVFRVLLSVMEYLSSDPTAGSELGTQLIVCSEVEQRLRGTFLPPLLPQWTWGIADSSAAFAGQAR